MCGYAAEGRGVSFAPDNEADDPEFIAFMERSMADQAYEAAMMRQEEDAFLDRLYAQAFGDNCE